MNRPLRAALTTALLLPIAACEDEPRRPTTQEILQARCLDLGGVYFEFEHTSAGSHVWCVKADGAAITLDGAE